MDKKAIAIIPARGGSKGIPRKNLKYFNGKPIISHVINACLEAKSIGCTYVSTDNEEIAKQAIECGAKVINRPAELSTDEVTLEPAIYHAVNKIEEQGIKSNLVAILQLTSPFIKSSSIDKVVKLLIDNSNIDSVITGYNDPHLGWHKVNNSLVPKYKERLCRQWLPNDYKETGGITCTRRKYIDEKNKLGKKVEIYELPKIECVDINDFYDWKFAESITQVKKILFIIKTNKGATSSIFISDFLGGHEIYFLSVDNSKIAEKQVLKNNYKVKNILESEINSFLKKDQFDMLVVEKSIMSLINDIEKITKIKAIDEMISLIKSNTLREEMEKIIL